MFEILSSPFVDKLADNFIENMDLERENKIEYSSFWDSIRISFKNGDKIVIFCDKKNSGSCRAYSDEWSKWCYMSGKKGRNFINKVRKVIKHEKLAF